MESGSCAAANRAMPKMAAAIAAGRGKEAASPKAFREHDSVDTVISDLCPPELRQNRLMLF